MTSSPSWVRPIIIGLALLLAGCHVPNADVTTTQDPQHPLNRQSKIGFPDALSVSSLSARLADENAQKQMQALGFNVVPLEQADYLAKADERPRNIAVGDTPGGPSVGTAIGGGSGGLFTGIGMSIPLGPSEAVIIHRTELAVSIETTQSPKLIIWQGSIVADNEDRAKYQGPFYRALLARVGMTFNGTVRLDKEEEVAPKP